MLPSNVRAPRLLVLADGAPLMGAFEAVVCSHGGFAASTFRVRAALGGDAADWAGRTQIAVEVRMSLSPAAGFVSVIEGIADLVCIDPIRGTLALEGRDASAALMETPIQESFANQTASEIATALAGRHGLAADVQATQAPVGRYWELGHDTLALNAAARVGTEWDLLALLAQHEGFALWVDGGALHFRAPEATQPALLPVAALTALRLERALTFAGDIAVTVKSWHSRAGAGCVGRARTARGGAVRDYVFVAPNLTQDAADALAARRLAELAGHELVLHAEMPGELALRARGAVQLQGSNSAFDTVYRIDQVVRRLDARLGFSQSLRARAALGAV